MCSSDLMYPIPDKHIKSYVNRITEGFDETQFADFQNRPYSYSAKIKSAIDEMTKLHTKQQFARDVQFDKIVVKPNYKFVKEINPLYVIDGLPKTLYEKEGKINDTEWTMINQLASLDNVLFWTRNNDRTGFCLNGFINHYPDFIVITKSGKVLLIETKGDFLDGSDSASKIKLGQLWESKAGNNYRYFMIYKNKNVEGAIKLDDFLQRVKSL